MFATQRLAASATGGSLGRGMAGDGHRPGLVLARDSAARRALTGTRVGTGLARHDGH